MRVFPFIIVVFLLSWLLLPSYAIESELRVKDSTHCLLTKNIKLDDLVDDAAIIFKGKLLSQKIIQEKNLNVRENRFKVLDPIRGIEKDKKYITIKEWAQFKSPIRKNETAVFFFYAPSRIGLTSLIGNEQGLVKLLSFGRLKYSSRLAIPNSQTQGINSKNLNSFSELKEYIAKKK